MGALLAKLREIFEKKKLELIIVGLDNSGKTTLLQALSGEISPHGTVPTIGSEVKEFRHKNVALRVWDLGGQTQRMQEARRELHTLLEEEALRKLPLLVVANKIDVDPHLSREQVVHDMNLDYITDVPWTAVAISAKFRTNLIEVIEYLAKHAKNP